MDGKSSYSIKLYSIHYSNMGQSRTRESHPTSGYVIIGYFMGNYDFFFAKFRAGKGGDHAELPDTMDGGHGAPRTPVRLCGRTRKVKRLGWFDGRLCLWAVIESRPRLRV